MNWRAERIITIIAILVVAAIMAGMAAVIFMQQNGSMDPDSTTFTLSFLSVTLTTVVVLFGALVLNSSRSDEYQKYVEEREREEREKE
ncbi:MAG: hypothetical protein IK043_00245 [Candidatus Methanomethylophilaceae archaeon]|nr:hypothetical protein [Candidatus Methanomethylophilaceae archaeon]